MDGFLISPERSGSACIRETFQVPIGQITEIDTPDIIISKGSWGVGGIVKHTQRFLRPSRKKR